MEAILHHTLANRDGCYTPENELPSPLADDHLLFGFVEGDAPARM